MRHALLGAAIMLGVATTFCGWRLVSTFRHISDSSNGVVDSTESITNTTKSTTDSNTNTTKSTTNTTKSTTTSTNITNSTINSTVSTKRAGKLPSSGLSSVSVHPQNTSVHPDISTNSQGPEDTQGTTTTSLHGSPLTLTVPPRIVVTQGSSGFENITTNSSQPLNSTEDDIDYVMMGQELLTEATTILDTGIWDFEKRTEDGDAIFSRQLNSGNMVYRLTGIVDMPAQDLLVIIFDGLADYSKWNPSLLDCRVLEKINDQTDIAYTVSAPGARGYVASRDFVSLRHWDMRHNTYVAASKSIDFPGSPFNPDYIRGENGPGCMEMRPLSSDPSKTEFRWLLNTKLNGWIPSYIADKAYKKFMTKYMVFLREYCKKIKQRANDFTLSSTSPTNITY